MNALDYMKKLVFQCIHRKKEKPMLQLIEFTFSSPICNCRKNNVRWGWETDFYITCQTCHTSLFMETSRLKARITFEKDYPEGNAVSDNILRIV